MKGIWIALIVVVATLVLILIVRQARATVGRRRRYAWLATVGVVVVASLAVVMAAL